MSGDLFIKIGDIKGESPDDVHKDEIEVISWNWGLSQSGSTHHGSGGGSGKVNVQDLSLTKYVDKASPVLMKMCCSGKHYPEALLTVRKAGETPLEYLLIKMEDVIVSSLQSGGSDGGDRLTENLTLNFAKVSVDYTPQKPDGSGDAPIKMGWDIAGNKEIG